MSPAAKAAAAAKAEADHNARAEAAAAAKAAKAASRPKTQRHFAAPPAAEVRFGRTSPAAQARTRIIATGIEAIAKAMNSDINLSTDEAKIVLQLEANRKQLKEYKATDRKIEAKVQMLPFYSGWVAGFMDQAKHEASPMDQVFSQLLAWTIDIGAYGAALPMIEYALQNNIEMPAGFQRDVATFAIDQICEAALFAFDLGDDQAREFDASVLPMLQDLVIDHEIDLHDEVEAKLLKAIGRACLVAADPTDIDGLRARQQSALASYRAAIAKNERVGVKKDIEKLERELKKTDPAAATSAA